MANPHTHIGGSSHVAHHKVLQHPLEPKDSSLKYRAMLTNATGIVEMHAHPRLVFSTIPLDTSRTTYLDKNFEYGMHGIHISYLGLLPHTGIMVFFSPLKKIVSRTTYLDILLIK